MQTITVKSVQEKHSKDGSKTFWVVTDTKGAELSTFDPEVINFQSGTVIETELEVSGKYTNLKSFKIISTPTLETKVDAPKTVPYQWTDNTASIEAQTAIKEIGECWRSGKFEDNDELVAIYRGWIETKLGVALPSTRKISNAPIPHAEDIFPPRETKTLSASTSTSETTPQNRQGEKKKLPHDPASIKDRNTFQKWCSVDFDLHSPRDICRELNVDAITLIADYGEAYTKIGAARGYVA